jgi:hypothetical protein
VTQVPVRPLGVLAAQPGTDLLRTPGVFELGGHQVPQFVVTDKYTGTLAPGVVTSAGMGEVGVIHTLVVRLEVTTQLP